MNSETLERGSASRRLYMHSPSAHRTVHRSLPRALKLFCGGAGERRQLTLFKLFRYPTDHLERNVALVAVLVLFIGVYQGKIPGL